MTIDTNDTKRAAILDAAYKVFTTYGYRRSNMEDIAREAGMSRPALYQVFRNKEDIFRAYVIGMKAQMVATVKDAFKATERPFCERLYDALDGALLAPHRFIESTPHGEEIIGVKTEIASDLFEDWLNEVEAALTDAFAREAAASRLSLSGDMTPARLARLTVNAMEGIKIRMASVAEGERSVRDLVGLLSATRSAI
jgi:AcrR family transcriptional regulator